MFTGLIEGLGTLQALHPQGGGYRLRVSHDLGSGVHSGDSVAVNGICLTAEPLEAAAHPAFEAVAGRETVERTTLGRWSVGQRVHLERALALGDRLGGHIVQGHVDGVGQVREIRLLEETAVLWVQVPTEIGRYLVEKGSVALDGVSLTVNEVRGTAIRVNIIPHTWSATGFPALRVGSGVNVEVDVLARYVERLLAREPSSGGDLMRRLQENGFAR